MKRVFKRFTLYRKVFFFHDLKASITVFFVALPLCLGISLASNAPVTSGLIAGIVGGLLIGVISKSPLSVSGPAAGLTAISAVAIAELGSLDAFFAAVVLAGIIQIILGIFRLGGISYFIPSSVIHGMLASIGIILVFKQVPAFLGYSAPDFWANKLFNILTLNHVFDNVIGLYENISLSVSLISLSSLVFLLIWDKKYAHKYPAISASFLVVVYASLVAYAINVFIPSMALPKNKFVSLPNDFLQEMKFLDLSNFSFSKKLWTNALIIAFIASIESLLSIAAIDKLDPHKRTTPQNRELIAQGIGNAVSGSLGGLPVTSVIVRSSANLVAGARTKYSTVMHALWLLLAVLLGVKLINHIPYGVLAAILIRTGYNLASPSLFMKTLKEGKTQFLPFMVTCLCVLLTDILIGVVIGIIYALYFIVKENYQQGFELKISHEGHEKKYTLILASHVSFLNKKKMVETLNSCEKYSIIEIDGSHCNFIDHDVMEYLQDFKTIAKDRHSQLSFKGFKFS